MVNLKIPDCYEEEMMEGVESAIGRTVDDSGREVLKYSFGPRADLRVRLLADNAPQTR